MHLFFSCQRLIAKAGSKSIHSILNTQTVFIIFLRARQCFQLSRILSFKINKYINKSENTATGISKLPATVAKISPADNLHLFGPETRLRAHNRYCACAQVCESIKIPLEAERNKNATKTLLNGGKISQKLTASTLKCWPSFPRSAALFLEVEEKIKWLHKVQSLATQCQKSPAWNYYSFAYKKIVQKNSHDTQITTKSRIEICSCRKYRYRSI